MGAAAIPISEVGLRAAGLPLGFGGGAVNGC